MSGYDYDDLLEAFSDDGEDSHYESEWYDDGDTDVDVDFDDYDFDEPDFDWDSVDWDVVWDEYGEEYDVFEFYSELS